MRWPKHIVLLLVAASFTNFVPVAVQHVPEQLSSPMALAGLVLIVGGALSGFLAGLLGIGGALVTLPVLYFALSRLGVDARAVPATAVSTALLAMLPTTVMAAWRQHRRGAIDVTWARRLVLPMSLGATLGAMAATSVQGPLLAWMFAAQSFYYGGRLILERSAEQELPTRGLVQSVCRSSNWLLGMLMAAFCACIGMGGGSMVAPYLRHRGVVFRHSVATASALNLTIAVAGCLTFACLANGTKAPGANWLAGMALAFSAVLAVPAGVRLAHRLPAPVLRRLIGAVNLISASTLVLQVGAG